MEDGGVPGTPEVTGNHGHRPSEAPSEVPSQEAPNTTSEAAASERDRVPAAGPVPGPEPGAEPGAELGEILTGLKERRGTSFEALAKRTGLTRSTAHRYCKGQTVPPSFAPIERLASVCGADRGELAELFLAWNRAVESCRAEQAGAPSAPADEPQAPPGQPPEAVAEQPPADGPGQKKPPSPSPVPETVRTVQDLLLHPGRRIFTVAAALLAVAVLTTSAVVFADGSASSPAPRGTASVQVVKGPAWTEAPADVPEDFFGVTLNSTTGTMPGFDVGAVRLWDSETRWSQLEPRRGQYNWNTLDRLVDGANKSALPVLFTFAGTPQWASPYGPRTAYPDSSRASPPDDLEDWNRFVRAVVTRYRGRIEAYELWVMAPSPRFFTGTAQTLATMARSGAEIVHTVDAKATVVCPSLGELWQPESRKFLKDFAGAGGYQDCDTAGVKLHQKKPGQTPESVLELTDLIDRTFHEAGVHPRLWNTGTTYRIATEDRLDEKKATDYAVRFYLVGLYAQYEREYFYNWGGHKIPIVLQAEGGPPTAAALAIQELQKWLKGAQITGCGNGTEAGLPERVFSCRFLLAPAAAKGTRNSATIRWTDIGTATMQVTGARTQVRHLDGSSRVLKPGARLEISQSPVLVVEDGTPVS